MAEKTITQLTAIDVVATADEFAVYDASATGTRKATVTQVKTVMTDVDINGLSSTTPAGNDSLPIYDLSLTANRKVAVSDITAMATLVDINGLTSAAPATNDSVVIYDLSATANRKATISDILALGSSSMDINGLTSTTPAANDSIPIYDLSLTANRKVAVSDITAMATLVDINGLTSATPATNDSVVIYDLSATANRKATVSDILALGGGSGSGKLAVTLTPYAAVLPSSNFPQLAHSNGRPILGFDASTNESCTWTFYAPAGLSGALSAKVHWIAASATSGDVIWNVEIEAVTAGDSTDLDATTSFDTANSGTTTAPGTAGYLAVTSITLTNADSVAAGDYVRVRLTRNASAGGDTATGDANVLLLAIQES